MKWTKHYPAYNGFEIGDYTYGSPNIVNFINSGKVIIGKYCSIAPQVTILPGGNHRPDWVTTYPFSDFRPYRHIKGHPSSKGDIIIGNDVWIGLGAVILSGVKIGDGAVIGIKIKYKNY